MITKIFGWILIIAGVALITWTIYYSFNIFTGKSDTPGPGLFKVEKTEKASTTDTKGLFDSLLGGITGELKVGSGTNGSSSLLPADFLPKTINLAAWSLLAWILISGGAQISSLGIKMVKS